MNSLYFSFREEVDPKHHRSHYIIHRDMWYLAEFDTKPQFDAFVNCLGLNVLELNENGDVGAFEEVYQDFLFTNKEQLPGNAKPIYALSNGSIVLCYFTNENGVLTFYRPNPNCKDIYQPFTLEQHIAHIKAYGTY